MDARPMTFSWVPKLKPDPTAQEARKWIEEMRRSVAINHPNQLVVQSVQAACQLQPAIFKVVIPTLTEGTAHTSAEVAKKMDEVLMTQWTLDMRGMPHANAIAFAIVQEAIEKDSMNEIMLENNSDWVANNDGTSKPQGYLCAHRAIKAIVYTFITNRLGSGQDVDRSAETRRNAAQKELEDLEFATEVSLSVFHMNFNRKVKNCKNEGCTPMSELQLTVKYLEKAKKHPIFAPSVLLMNAGSMQYPENTVEALKKLSEIEVLTKDIPHGFVVTGSDKSSGPMPAFVLATRVMTTTKSKKSGSPPSRGISSQNGARTYITKSDGTRRVSKSDWNIMTDEEKDQLISENKAIRDKSDAQDDKGSGNKKVMTTVKREGAVGEFDESDDREWGILDDQTMYKSALMVIKTGGVADSAAECEYDEFMVGYNNELQSRNNANTRFHDHSDTACTMGTMTITTAHFQAAIKTAADTAARLAVEAMTTHDDYAVQNRGAQRVQNRGAQQLCDSFVDAIEVVAEEKLSYSESPFKPLPTWLLLIFTCATAILVQWLRVMGTSSDEGCIGSE
jgi:hypothetical protein